MEYHKACTSYERLENFSWKMVTPESLHALRSLLFTATNEVSHDRFFNFARRSMFGTTTSSWMSEPGPVYVLKHVRRT